MEPRPPHLFSVADSFRRRRRARRFDQRLNIRLAEHRRQTSRATGPVDGSGRVIRPDAVTEEKMMKLANRRQASGGGTRRKTAIVQIGEIGADHPRIGAFEIGTPCGQKRGIIGKVSADRKSAYLKKRHARRSSSQGRPRSAVRPSRPPDAPSVSLVAAAQPEAESWFRSATARRMWQGKTWPPPPARPSPGKTQEI